MRKDGPSCVLNLRKHIGLRECSLFLTRWTFCAPSTPLDPASVAVPFRIERSRLCFLWVVYAVAGITRTAWRIDAESQVANPLSLCAHCARLWNKHLVGSGCRQAVDESQSRPREARGTGPEATDPRRKAGATPWERHGTFSPVANAPHASSQRRRRLH